MDELEDPMLVKRAKAIFAGQIPATRRIERFKFNLCDRVLVKEIQRPGVVDTLLIDGLGVQYWVSYWNDSKRERVLMFEWELELRNTEV